MEKIRIGLIGCGGIAHGHMQRLDATGNAEIVALADPNPAMIEKIQKAFPKLESAQKFADYKEMLEKVKLDAVGIFSPHTLHFQQAMDSLDKDSHVLLEKPMVCTVEHAKKLIAKIEKKKKVLLVSYQRHYMPAFRYMRELISSGKFGKVRFVSAMQCQNWYISQKGTWRQKKELSGGGQLNDSGSHLVDIILWITGLEPSEVFGYIDNMGTPIDINSALSIKFKNGAQAAISVVAESPIFLEEITIWGENGVFYYCTHTGVLMHQGGELNKPAEQVQISDPTSNPDANIINVILGKEKNESPAIGGLRVAELTEAAWKSGETGKPVGVSP